jgi:hypothetical protein
VGHSLQELRPASSRSLELEPIVHLKSSEIEPGLFLASEGNRVHTDC